MREPQQSPNKQLQPTPKSAAAFGFLRLAVLASARLNCGVRRQLPVRRALLLFEILGMIAFGVALLFSYTSEEGILARAKSWITYEILPKANAAVDVAEEGLKSPLAAQYLSADQIADLETEITRYRTDPEGYISSITGSDYSTVHEREGQLGLGSLAAKLLDWKAKIREYFRTTFNRLMQDLRLFLASNTIAFGIALFLLEKTEELGPKYFVASAVLVLAVCVSAFGYLDQNWFFTILFRTYAGWTYPVGLALLFGWLLYDYYRGRAADA